MRPLESGRRLKQQRCVSVRREPPCRANLSGAASYDDDVKLACHVAVREADYWVR